MTVRFWSNNGVKKNVTRSIKTIIYYLLSLCYYSQANAVTLLCEGTLVCHAAPNFDCRIPQSHVSFSIDLSNPDVKKEPNNYIVQISSDAVHGMVAVPGSEFDATISVARLSGQFIFTQNSVGKGTSQAAGECVKEGKVKF